MVSVRCVSSVIFVLVILGGCDPTVDSFRENERHYSIFGYLNASADTQFVRVEPLRDGLLTRFPETLDAEVTLTNRATNRTVTLRDSLFRYLDRATAHNFYTTADIDSATRYQLRVQGAGEAESHARVVIPDSKPRLSVVSPVKDFEELNCQSPYRGNPSTVVAIQGVSRIVSVRALYDLNATRSYGHLADTVHKESEAVEARIEYLDDICQMSEPAIPKTIKVMVAAGIPSWPEFLRLEETTELLPGMVSNVEDGVGVVGGIMTDTVTVHPYFDN